jgi:hypothetical protein
MTRKELHDAISRMAGYDPSTREYGEKVYFYPAWVERIAVEYAADKVREALSRVEKATNEHPIAMTARFDRSATLDAPHPFVMKEIAAIRAELDHKNTP